MPYLIKIPLTPLAGANVQWAKRGLPPQNYPRTHCRRGHELTESNIYYSTTRGNTVRSCKICKKAKAAIWKRAQRTARLRARTENTNDKAQPPPTRMAENGLDARG